MLFKQEHLTTYEAYKKAMHLSASQIKDGTKYCIYNEVHLKDAGGKPQILKPFLVIGSGHTNFKPLLGHLHGGARKLVCEGTCSLKEGKVTLDGEKVPFGKLKSKATHFKEILGKPLGIPSGVQDEEEDEGETAEGKARPLPVPPAKPPVAANQRPPVANVAATAAKLPPPPPPKPGVQAAKTAPPAPPANAGPEPHHVRLAKASMAWHGTRSIVDNTCKGLKQAIRSHYGNHHPDVLKAIDGNMHKIDALTVKLDHRLAEALKKASAAQNEAAKATELKNARAILNEYINFARSEPLLEHIDRNPFGVKSNLRQTLAASLKHMADSLIA